MRTKTVTRTKFVKPWDLHRLSLIESFVLQVVLPFFASATKFIHAIWRLWWLWAIFTGRNRPRIGDGFLNCLSCHLSIVSDPPSMVIKGNGESGFDSQGTICKTATTLKKGGKCANCLPQARGDCDKKYQCGTPLSGFVIDASGFHIPSRGWNGQQVWCQQVQ